QGVVDYIQPALRSAGTFVFPRRELSAQARAQRAKAILVERKRMGDGRTRPCAGRDAREISDAREIRGAVPADGRASSRAPGPGWSVASGPAGRGGVPPA